eukprot:4752401-Pyramimonas_sp.AAC.1
MAHWSEQTATQSRAREACSASSRRVSASRACMTWQEAFKPGWSSNSGDRTKAYPTEDTTGTYTLPSGCFS